VSSKLHVLFYLLAYPNRLYQGRCRINTCRSPDRVSSAMRKTQIEPTAGDPSVIRG